VHKDQDVTGVGASTGRGDAQIENGVRALQLLVGEHVGLDVQALGQQLAVIGRIAEEQF